MKNLSKVIVAGLAFICLGLSASATSNKVISDTTKKSKMSKMDSNMDSKMAPGKMDSKMNSKMAPAKMEKKASAKMKKDTNKMSKM